MFKSLRLVGVDGRMLKDIGDAVAILQLQFSVKMYLRGSLKLGKGFIYYTNFFLNR